MKMVFEREYLNELKEKAISERIRLCFKNGYEFIDPIYKGHGFYTHMLFIGKVVITDFLAAKDWSVRGCGVKLKTFAASLIADKLIPMSVKSDDIPVDMLMIPKPFNMETEHDWGDFANPVVVNACVVAIPAHWEMEEGGNLNSIEIDLRKAAIMDLKELCYFDFYMPGKDSELADSSVGNVVSGHRSMITMIKSIYDSMLTDFRLIGNLYDGMVNASKLIGSQDNDVKKFIRNANEIPSDVSIYNAIIVDFWDDYMAKIVNAVISSKEPEHDGLFNYMLGRYALRHAPNKNGDSKKLHEDMSTISTFHRIEDETEEKMLKNARRKMIEIF